MTIGLAPVLCLALNIYGEARGEDPEGQLAVAQVTLNRVEHPAYPDDICAVVFQEKQFSWTNHSVSIQEPEAFNYAMRIAVEVLLNRPPDLTDGSTHFYSGNKRPSWASAFTTVGRIGNHTFLKKE